MAELVAGLVVDALISAAVERLFERLASAHVVDFIRRKNVDQNLLEDLKRKLTAANGVLDDAEKKMITKPAVREWLVKLQDEIHNAEDLVDEINTEALQREFEGTGQFGWHNPVSNFFSSRFSVKNVEYRLRKISESLKDVVKEMNELGLIKGVETNRPSRVPVQAVYMVRESDICGRDADKEAIMKFLLSDEKGRQQISVMPIVGMAGIGKTTLAQLAFNNIKDNMVAVEKPFDFIAWITVSDESDVSTLTKAIYKEVNGKEDCTEVETFKLQNTVSDESDVSTLIKAIYKEVNSKEECTEVETFKLQKKLHKVLEGKKFFFVLDDVWSVDYRIWNELRKPFESAAHGSKIIVTTRSTQIALVFSTAKPHVLQLLEDEDCWKLFSKHAFGNEETSSHPNYLEEIGRQIANKCKGIPLALKSLACLLHGQQDPKEWKSVLESDFWEIPQKDGGDILPALWLSYYYLPRHLKRCFAYCSIFPKDYEIEKEKLILLWMAEDLLQSPNNLMLEDIGEKYFDDLTSRSFFQVSRNGKRFTMHDLVNDLAKFVSGESCLRLDDKLYSEDLKWKNLTRKTRHISCTEHMTPDIIKKLKDLPNNEVLRTLLLLGDPFFEVKDWNINPKQLQSMQYLRVLSASKKTFIFEDRFLKKLFKSVGSLKLLRYLDLSGVKIKEISGTICMLYNLQTLRLSSCSRLAKLPDSIGNLKHLRYLDLSSTDIEEIPDTIGALHNLQKLLLSSCGRLATLPDSIGNLKNLRHLDLSESSIKKIPDTVCNLQELRVLDIKGSSLREMPPHISKLKLLQTLTGFVIGKNSGSNIEELGKLVGDYIEIKILDNDVDGEDISKANLKDKRCIRELSLKWEGDEDDSDNQERDMLDDSDNKARDVLDRLQPHTNIEKLSIINYGGRSFADWVAHHSFSHIESVKLHWVWNCRQLPPLGQLPSLKSLDILGFGNLEKIGDEFYSSGSSSSSSSGVEGEPFKSLEFLKFSFMPHWEEWSLVGGAFSNLKELQFDHHHCHCRKLNGACLPEYLPSLTKLEISSTSLHVVASLARCEYPSLGSLTIRRCSELKSFPQGRLPSSIHTINIKWCDKLVSLSEEGWPCSNLKTLFITHCGKLFADSNGTRRWNLGMLTSLTSLKICIAEGVESFPEEEGQLPTSLTSLDLDSFKNLKSLNETAFRHLTSLQSLDIYECPQLQCLPEDGMPASLTRLCLFDLPNLKSLNANTFRHLTTLRTLRIEKCPQVKCLPEERLPASLSKLYIDGSPLNKRCQKNKGRDWDKIKHIPNIFIDDKRI